MSWTIRWHVLAERDFYDLPHWQTAERIDTAILRFASSAEGDVRRVDTPSGKEFRLLVPPYFVRISRDRASRTIHVWRIVRYA